MRAMKSLSSLTIPQALEPGDKIAVVASSWGGPGTFPWRYEAGVKQLQEAFGVQVVPTRHALKPAAWVAKNPKARADDLMEAFANPNIKGIISAIGGADSVRLVPHMDLGVIRANPKVYLGYSDSTVTHFMCLAAGVRSYYGPSIMAGFAENCGPHPYMVDSVRRVLFNTDPVGEMGVAPRWTNEHLPWEEPANQLIKRKMVKNAGRRVLQGKGMAEGRALPMCADLFPMLSGTSIWPKLRTFEGAVLFLETSEDMPPQSEFTYWLRNIGVQGIFSKLAGIVLARPFNRAYNKPFFGYDETLQRVVADEFGEKRLPIIAQADFGHTDPMFTIPYGANVHRNCKTGGINFPEPGVR